MCRVTLDIGGQRVFGNATKFCAIAIHEEGADNIQMELSDSREGNSVLIRIDWVELIRLFNNAYDWTGQLVISRTLL